MDGEGVSVAFRNCRRPIEAAKSEILLSGDEGFAPRVHQGPNGGKPPSGPFGCFSTFVHGTLPHNELAWCFPSNDGKEVHVYWYDDEMHQKYIRVGLDLSAGVHTYTTRWREVGIDWLIDDMSMHASHAMY